MSTPEIVVTVLVSIYLAGIWVTAIIIGWQNGCLHYMSLQRLGSVDEIAVFCWPLTLLMIVGFYVYDWIVKGFLWVDRYCQSRRPYRILCKYLHRFLLILKPYRLGYIVSRLYRVSKFRRRKQCL